MTRQTWTAVVAALCFVACASALALVPVPFVVWSPGTTVDLLASDDQKAVVKVSDASFPTSGRLLLPTVSVSKADTQVSILEALYAYWAKDRDVLARSAVYPAGSTDQVIADQESNEMTASQMNAVAAALQQAKRPITPVPIVTSVSSIGPAADKLHANDIVLAVDATSVRTEAEVTQAIAARKVGDPVTFTVLRGADTVQVKFNTVAHKTDPDIPVAGAAFGLGYRYDTKVDFSLDPQIGGSSAGLVLALAVYDKLTPGSLIGSRIVSGTGSIDGTGKVGAVGGVREKMVAAEKAGATVFLLPAANCSDALGDTLGLRLVAVTKLDDAVASLTALSDPAKAASVKGCS